MKKSGQVWVRTTGARADEPSGTYARYVRRSGIANGMIFARSHNETFAPKIAKNGSPTTSSVSR